MSRSLAAALAKLLASEGDTPASLFTEAQRKALDELLRRTGGASTLRQGRGVVYRISQRVSLETVLRDLSPADADTLPHDLPARARNVATRRDSKGGESGHGLHYMVLKAVGENVSWAADDGRHIELSPLTDIAGAAALAIRPTDSWHSSQPLWLIENQALFDRTDWLPEGTRASLAYYGGQIPAALLAWFAARPRAAAVILLPAAVMVAVGLLGIVLHTFELLLVGGWKAMRLGLVFGAVTASVLGIMYLSPRPVEGQTILEMLVLPAVVVAFGLLGGLLRLTGRTLILTDNRAKLMNAVMGGLLSILAMFVLAPTGVEFFPDTDPNQIKVEVKAR